ncbi:MAG: Single-stranded DNA-binding protein [Candidatus Nomurabacteria bacterium GW2011_GWE1_32_28]|uniref:Single-stranded DNA-binding protein n=1 Tax=Candidatus Nomurabacteria bacterium GW2011_GWF1_31_48 TaxID=1618767 RepID=A0A0F9YE88_9BACT|nr:MAG: Single-stranded DNA-binding protein [Candidatus Nomurabacteria bacterium GW2011_GWF2_30_133]KKP28449.1 MAG: Single-stranded DNA-binding protein [Candidatus Nomurabacteria bacterium GW2011_GWE2_31_40]KKP30029.1 MAG: Single-stranded DNA-binding protein [Candidatus Nomurabacteria bacterium GW2011_GWF1_31_48]KKP34548.1 MAG: Single-stranded DNA-binding protein [Candidatus Nomurabacteria bacterium GW2011_GWE1_32_28]HAS81054.1 single-stranded DNA-binding protein [Candidatus Nomurabacteria bact
MYLNKAIVIGNLTRDPEIRSLPSGIKVCSFSLATNRVWKDKNNARQESTDYHNVVVFGRQAETVAQYMKKGSSILIEGRMQTRSWEDKTSGEKKYRTEIVADRTQFGPKGGSSGASTPSADSEKVSGTKEEIDTIEYPEEDINPEDIPF